MTGWRNLAVAATAVAAVAIAEAFWVSGKYEARVDECVSLKAQLEEANRTIAEMKVTAKGQVDEIVISVRDDGKRTKSIENRNPFNVKKPSGEPFKGTIGYDREGHCIFASEAYGVRAGIINLLSQERKYGIDTIDALVEKYCTSNKPDYKKFLSKRIGVGVKEKFSIRQHVRELAPAMVRFETGKELPQQYKDLIMLVSL